MFISSEYYEAVLARLKTALNAKTDVELSKALGLKSRAAIIEAKKRGTVPTRAIIETAIKSEGSLSLDYVFGVKKSNGAAE